LNTKGQWPDEFANVGNVTIDHHNTLILPRVFVRRNE
jgi:hypothetical protein